MTWYIQSEYENNEIKAIGNTLVANGLNLVRMSALVRENYGFSNSWNKYCAYFYFLSLNMGHVSVVLTVIDRNVFNAASTSVRIQLNERIVFNA